MKFPFLFKSPETTAGNSIHSPERSEFSVKGVRPSERFFFEPGKTNSILEEAKSRTKRVAVLEIDSADPFLDFRASMEEMAEAHALKDWDDLENLLSCYLRVNRRNNHGYIIGAFVDLVILRLAPESSVAAAAADENCSSSSLETHECSDFTSPLYSFSSYSDEVEKDGGGSYAASFLSNPPCSSRV